MIDLKVTTDWIKGEPRSDEEVRADFEPKESKNARFKVFDVRSKQGRWEKQNAILQRRLVREYDAWSTQVRRVLKNRLEAGAAQAELERHVLSSMPALEARMVATLAGSLNGLVKSPIGVLENIIRNKTVEAAKAVREDLVPGIRDKILSSLRAGGVEFKPIFDAVRYRPASYAGIHWVALFEVQKGMGLQREIERQRACLPIEPVRWVLDPNAAHCADSPGYFGCPGIAKVYASWGDLPAVPAGQVTCRGNCRCIIEVKIGGRWTRGVPTFASG